MLKYWLLLFFFFLMFLALFFLLLVTTAGAEQSSDMTVIGQGQRYTEHIPVFDISDFGYDPRHIPTTENSSLRQTQLRWAAQGKQFIPSASSTLLSHSGQALHPSSLILHPSNNPYALIHKTAPTFIQPGATVRYDITLANYDAITHTYQLTDRLPSQLTYVPDSTNDLHYDDTAHTLTWQGEMPPGNLDYLIEESGVALPYLDLAEFGAVNLCDEFIANGADCDDVTVTFNLGVNGYSTQLYGETVTQLVLSANGTVLAHDATENQLLTGHNRWLPDVSAPELLLAGLWRDVDMTTNGRFHAAILRGLIQDHDVFYAQWHDAPHADDPDLTARHVIALVLNGTTSASSVTASTGSATVSTSSAEGLVGHAFFIYDNISDPTQTIARGYTIGLTDNVGRRGVTYAYAPCCGDVHLAQGVPPSAGTTLHLRPTLFGADNNYWLTFSYEAIVKGQVPETIVNTAVVTTDADDPALAYAWSTHYLYLRLQTYLPFLRTDEVTP